MKFYASLQMDISFYINWLCARLHDGFFDIERTDKIINRYHFKDAEEIILFTKNPSDIYKNKDILKDYHVKLVTFISCYDRFFEPNIKDKEKIIRCIQRSKNYFQNYFGYGPIFYTDINDKEWHLIQFKQLCKMLYRYTKGIYIDFQVGKKCQEDDSYGITIVNPDDIIPELTKIAKSYGLKLFLKPRIEELKDNEIDMGIADSCPLLCAYCPFMVNKMSAATKYKYCTPDNPLIYGVATKKQKIVIVSDAEVPVQQTLF